MRCMCHKHQGVATNLRALSAVLTRAACARRDCSCRSCWCSFCHACCPHFSWWFCFLYTYNFRSHFSVVEMYSIHYDIGTFVNAFIFFVICNFFSLGRQESGWIKIFSVGIVPGIQNLICRLFFWCFCASYWYLSFSLDSRQQFESTYVPFLLQFDSWRNVFAQLRRVNLCIVCFTSWGLSVFMFFWSNLPPNTAAMVGRAYELATFSVVFRRSDVASVRWPQTDIHQTWLPWLVWQTKHLEHTDRAINVCHQGFRGWSIVYFCSELWWVCRWIQDVPVLFVWSVLCLMCLCSWN